MKGQIKKVEQLVATALSYFPHTKAFLKRLYQWIGYLLFTPAHPLKAYTSLRQVKIPGKKEVFFGYYDKSPFSLSGNTLITHACNHLTKGKPNPYKPISIVLTDLDSGQIIGEWESQAYNWQQGSRLQWIDEEEFMFNTYNSNTRALGSLRVNKNGKIVKKYSHPIYDVYSGKYALTLNFARLNLLCKDYGYRCDINYQESALTDLANDGIFKLDLQSGDFNLLVSLEQICSLDSNKTIQKALHTVNHLMIAPDGGQFIFIHRYYIKGRRFDRLIHSDFYGRNLKVLIADGLASHFSWIDSERILGYFSTKEHNRGYGFIDVRSGEIARLTNRPLQALGDGHPSMYNEEWILTDTYPNRSRMKFLGMFNITNDLMIPLGEFFESLDYYSETRCDLHPRINFGNNIVSFDSVHCGVRGLYWLDLNEIKDWEQKRSI